MCNVDDHWKRNKRKSKTQKSDNRMNGHWTTFENGRNGDSRKDSVEDKYVDSSVKGFDQCRNEKFQSSPPKSQNEQTNISPPSVHFWWSHNLRKELFVHFSPNFKFLYVAVQVMQKYSNILTGVLVNILRLVDYCTKIYLSWQTTLIITKKNIVA